MATRYVLVTSPGETQPRIVPEQSVRQEVWLQEQVKQHIELIPAADLDLQTPLLVVGRETGLGAAGAADLIAVDMTGEVVVVEFKRGPDNPDTRRVVAQLLDYGAQLFRMSYEEFDRTVARRYFDSPQCHRPELKGKSLAGAATLLWGGGEEEREEDPSDFDAGGFREKLGQRLAAGELTYVVVSTRITDRTRAVLEYLTSAASFRVFGVELSHFSDDELSVFVPRAITYKSDAGDTRSQTNRDEMLSKLRPHGREVLEYVLDQLETTEGEICWGTVGFSYRPETAGQSVSILYGYPASGRQENDTLQVYFPMIEETLSDRPAVAAAYREATRRLPGIQYTKTGKTGRVLLTPEFTLEHADLLLAAIEGVLEARGEREAT